MNASDNESGIGIRPRYKLCQRDVTLRSKREIKRSIVKVGVSLHSSECQFCRCIHVLFTDRSVDLYCYSTGVLSVYLLQLLSCFSWFERRLLPV